MTKSKKRPTIAKSEANDNVATISTPLSAVLPVVVAAASTVPETVVPTAKKPATRRAPASRKGKTSKLTASASTNGDVSKDSLQIANIILHLKCSMDDLNQYNEELKKQLTNPLVYNPVVPPDIMTYHQPNNYSELNEPTSYDTADFAYMESKCIRESAMAATAAANNEPSTIAVYSDTDQATTEVSSDVLDEQSRLDFKDIHVKLKKLKISLFKNMAYMDKKSACFWCTYDFDNPECYIPKYEMDGAIHGYGSFCRPECAAAYLMKENLDDSTKFERYHLLNHIYGKVYDYKRNIKPAPNPYYMLDKFYGNLSIQEYRKLLKSDHLLLVIEKPLTRVLPELHEDNEEFMTNIYGVTTTTKTMSNASTGYGVYKVRRQSDKPAGPNKSSLVKEHFGLK